MPMIHTGEKPYACSVCVTKIRQKNTLRKHEENHIFVEFVMIHSGEKPVIKKHFPVTTVKRHSNYNCNSICFLSPFCVDIILNSYISKTKDINLLQIV